MLRLLLLTTAYSLSFSIVAQFGISGFYNTSLDDFTSITYPDGGSLTNGYEVSADYWFRLKNKRIEFLPTVSFGRYENSIAVPPLVSEESVNVDFTFNEFGFQFKTNFYLLDFGTDCDCPTFGKQGPALHKGFFVQLAPGISLWEGKSVASTFTDRVQKDRSTIPHLGIGLGLDFGFSNLVTVTPIVSYRYYFTELSWEGQREPCDVCDLLPNENNVSTLQAGIRLGIRLDKRKY
ncbi:MAG: hypothetical protein AAFQ37_06125 [Bacteroidota bacterium]